MPYGTPQGIFITGTDTGVGKTIVAAVLAARFKKSGFNVGVMKPVQTGCLSRRGERIAPDALFLLQAAGVDDPMDWVCPYRFKTPAAPLVAADRERRTIELDQIAEAYAHLISRHRIVVVEGIGGLLTPITPTVSALDLALLLKLPLIVVASTRIGTLNHTLLTVRWAQQAGATVLGIIFNQPQASARSIAEKTNPQVIARLCAVPVLGTLPFMAGVSVEKGRLGRVRALGDHLNKGLHHLGIKLNP
ncbi:MAG TPA: dethiobiotin synthase [Nitrospiria bacterium]|nr:dethiobiotin synthase [Nitrospiria bacterium]HUK55166.1 dethiobiotin synthase [Nitrospiria bacterium]